MAHEVFISHSSADRLTADAVRAALETAQIPCWIAPRDVEAGKSYGGQITRAIQHARIMVLVLSARSNTSTAVLSEVELAANAGLQILNFRVDDSPLSDDLRFYLQHRHWLDAFEPPLERRVEELVRVVQGLRSSEDAAPVPVGPASGISASHPAGGGSRPPRKWRLLTALLLAAVCLAVACVAGARWLSRSSTVTPAKETAPQAVIRPVNAGGAAIPVPEKSIAVLPFDSLSDDKSNAYFAEGIQDEILTDLSKVADMKVISRTSVRAYGAGQASNVREIGIALGVAHLLEGSVQKSGARVRVTTQLIDTRTDTQLWAEHFDGELVDIFAMQSQMAERIVGSLRARLSPGEKAAIAARPTADLAAYDLYLRAKELVATYQETADWRATLLDAVRLLDEATARDQGFALAYCLAAKAHDQLHHFGLDATPARLALQEDAVATAQRLQPDLGETRLARALLLYHGKRDYAGARRELEAARAALPNNAEVFSLTSFLDRREGRWQEALPNQERALSLDPRNSSVLNDGIILYDMMHLYRDEIRAADAAIRAVPDSADYFRMLKVWPLLAAGQTAEAREELDRLPAAYDPNGATTFLRVCAALYDRRPAEAADVLAAFKGSEYPGINGLMTPRGLLEALVARAAGDGGLALRALLTARASVEGNVRARPADANALALLGLIDAGLGRKEDALREVRRAVEMCPLTTDAMDGPGVETMLAQVCAWTGEPDEALRRLTVLARTPGGPDYGQLKSDPMWDPLRGRADFTALVSASLPNRP